MKQGLTSLLLLVMAISVLESCGFDDNPRSSRSRSQIRNQFRRNSTLTGGGFESLKREIRELSLSSIERPTLGEEIEYRIRFEQPRRQEFTLPEGSCAFEYDQARITEKVVTSPEMVNIQHIQSSTVPESPTYVGLPIEELKKKCLDAVSSTFRIQSLRVVDLNKVVENYQKFLNGQILNLVNKCELRGDLSALGRCNKLQMNVKLEQEVLFENMNVYKVEASIELLKRDQPNTRFSVYLNLKRPYFAYFGIIHLNGLPPEKAQDSSQEIKSLELLRWTKN